MGSLATETTSTFTPPLKQRALTVNDHDEVTIWDDAPCPKLPVDQVYVRVEAVALNPSDTKMRGNFATPWAFLGTDYCGTVVAVGSEITHIKVGDRVYGAQNEMCPRTPDQGAFAQYTITRGRIWAKVPDSWTAEAAAALPAGISTAGLALKLLDIPLPYTSDAKPSKTTYVLVYGGSTATATIIMQFLREYVAKPNHFLTIAVSIVLGLHRKWRHVRSDHQGHSLGVRMCLTHGIQVWLRSHRDLLASQLWPGEGKWRSRGV
jgi:D-arabinose 1-dehydrogenase-like Zn-dependent alcohol dehydrogenase